MRVRRCKEKWGPRRDGPVHKSIPNFRRVNILALPLAALPGGGVQYGCIFHLPQSSHNLQVAIQAATERSRPHKLDFRHSNHDPNLGSRARACLFNDLSFITNLLAEGLEVAHSSREKSENGWAAVKLQHRETRKAQFGRSFFLVAMDARYK